MRQILVPILAAGALLFQGCQPAMQAQTVRPEPSPTLSYTSHCIELLKNNPQPSLALGYGTGSTLQEAKQAAYRDIAEHFEVSIISESELLNRKQGTNVSQQYQSRITTFAATHLDDLSIECLDKPGDGRIHVTLGYDSRPLSVRIADKLTKHLGHPPGTLQLSGPITLTESQLVHDIQHRLRSQHGTGNVPAAISLHRRQGRWHLGIGEYYTPLSDNQLDQAINWQVLSSGNNHLKVLDINGRPLPGNIKNETEFRLAFNSQQAGYLQLLAIYENGEVAIQRNDISTQPGKQHRIPEGEGAFEAGLFDRNKQATDLYLALVTPTLLSDTGLRLQNSNLGTDNHYLQDLLEQLERQNLRIAVLPLTIVP